MVFGGGRVSMVKVGGAIDLVETLSSCEARRKRRTTLSAIVTASDRFFRQSLPSMHCEFAFAGFLEDAGSYFKLGYWIAHFE